MLFSSSVALSIPSPPVSSFQLGPLTIHFYALCILAGIVVAAIMTNHRLTKRGAEPWVVIDICLLAVPLAIIGARIFHVLTHPDFYFGLEPVMAAFPDVKVLADQHVVDHINQTKDAKLSYWSPILGKGAPKSLTVPQVMTASHLTLDGEKIEIKEMNTPNAYLWAPSIKTAFGGVPVYHGVHVWMADSQTKSARSNWVKALDNLLALKPERVVPGHFLGTAPKGTAAVTFTRDYVQRFEQELAKAKNSDQLIDGLKKAFPSLPVDDGLAIGAKVNMGEMKW